MGQDEKTHEWETYEQPILFELRMPIEVPPGDPEKSVVIERTPDEGSARMAFDAVRKALTYLKPRPSASLELYLGTTVLDVFEQTREGAEHEVGS